MKITANKKQSLLSLLKISFSESSNRTIKTWILNRRITINEVLVTKPHYIVEEGSIVCLTPQKKQFYPQLNVIFESDNYLVLSKPANLLTVPLDQGLERNVFKILKRNYPSKQILPINRLDREVSGLVLFAKNKRTQDSFKDLFEKRKVNKFYIALVENNFDVAMGTFDSSLKELKNFHVVVDHLGKEAITNYKVISGSKRYNTILLNPKTGRKHQLRVHCSNAENPILGDKRYGSKVNFHKRIALHAAYLDFVDPITKEKKEFFSMPPFEFCMKNQKKIYASIKEALNERRI